MVLAELDSDTQLILVGGTGRSGTTLVRQILLADGRFSGFGSEARFLSDAGGVFDFTTFLSSDYSAFDYDVRVRQLLTLLEKVADRWRPLDVASVAGSGANSTQAATAVPMQMAKSVRRIGRAALTSRAAPSYAGVGVSRAIRDWNAIVAELASSLARSEYEGRWAGTPRFQVDQVLFAGPEESLAALRAFMASILSGASSNFGSLGMVDDTPHGILKLDAALQVCPSTLAIHVKRNPVDVVASMRRMRWAPSDVEACARFVDHHLRALQRVETKLGAHIEKIDLEALVQSPTTVLDPLSERLGLTTPLLWPKNLERRIETVGRARQDLTAAERTLLSRQFGWDV